jgi:hypothetical protein
MLMQAIGMGIIYACKSDTLMINGAYIGLDFDQTQTE